MVATKNRPLVTANMIKVVALSAIGSPLAFSILKPVVSEAQARLRTQITCVHWEGTRHEACADALIMRNWDTQTHANSRTTNPAPVFGYAIMRPPPWPYVFTPQMGNFSFRQKPNAQKAKNGRNLSRLR